MEKENVKEITKEDKRNYGLEALRILSMFLVLTIHYIGRSELTAIRNNTTYNWYIYNFLLAIALVANNCYVLITGYFSINSKFKLKKVIFLCGEAWFYSIGITLLLTFLGYNKLTFKSTIEMFFPLLTRKYWFVSFYIVLYILSPFLNKMIKHFTKKELKSLIIILLIIFSVLGGTIQRASYAINSEGSFSFIWFVTLYIIASYIRLYGNFKFTKKYLLIGLLAAITVTTLNILKVKFPILNNFAKFYQTTNIFIFIESITLFLYFKDLKIKNNIIKKSMLVISPLTLAVYLIHQTPALDAILYKKILHTQICYNNNWAIPITIISIIILFVVLLFIEYIRKKIVKFIGTIIKRNKIYDIIAQKYHKINDKLSIVNEN